MPIGFAKSILAQGTTATGANSFVGWDGTNDHTFTRNAAVLNFIGFAPFTDEYGVMISSLDSGGGTRDKIQYDVMRNNSGTLSITSQGNILINDVGTSGYTAQKFGLVAPLQDGKVLYDPKDTNESDYKIFSFDSSDNTVTATGGGTSNRTMHSTPIFVDRASDSTGYNNISNHKLGETIATGNHFESTPTVSTESSSNDSYFYSTGNGVPGFVDNDTPFFLNSTDNGATLQPYKIDLGTAGSQSPTAFSGSPTNSQTMSQFDTANSTNFSTNGFEIDVFATPPFNSVAFNDLAIFVRREGGSPSNKFVFDSYKANDSSVQRSNIVTLSAGSSGSDTSGTCCFVGENNDVFLFAYYSVVGTRVIVLKYVHSTNTLSEVLNFSETLPSSNEEVRLHRWGSSGAILTYGTTKMRLLQA